MVFRSTKCLYIMDESNATTHISHIQQIAPQSFVLCQLLRGIQYAIKFHTTPVNLLIQHQSTISEESSCRASRSLLWSSKLFVDLPLAQVHVHPVSGHDKMRSVSDKKECFPHAPQYSREHKVYTLVGLLSRLEGGLA